MRKLLLLYILQLASLISCSQTNKPKIKDWHLLDFKKDGYRGISLSQAYELLKGKKSSTVIVAVIDSGIDTLQDDLKDNFWKNPKEIPYNNIDDDKNVLVDDVTGWNFLGGANKENLSISVSEEYRLYHRFKNEFEGKKDKNISPENKFVFEEWEKAAAIINNNYTSAKKEITNLRSNFSLIQKTNTYLIKFLATPVFTRKNLSPGNKADSVSLCSNIWTNIFSGKDFTNTDFVKDYESYLKKQEEAITQKTVLPTDYRGKLLNDSGYDISKTNYGNTNLQTHSGYHGTSVSSIIGAVVTVQK